MERRKNSSLFQGLKQKAYQLVISQWDCFCLITLKCRAKLSINNILAAFLSFIILRFNPQTHEIVGLAMSTDELLHMGDFLSPDLEKPIKAEYILQTLYRDMVSKFDVVGPAFALKSGA